jgi:hypothetical protein
MIWESVCMSKKLPMWIWKVCWKEYQ